ncbi:hypothetical protein [Kangiella sp.]|uniref:hypothetical protein n=1 Tax=Kangiella sp. TaxID=1920245 RepID=UPI00198FA094|nr:hypothetical protein [Kangiella sp.]MBD3653206.1 hypothetical protein [Kangiella sp.]
MSKRCANMFEISDFISGGIFGFSVLVALLSFFVPHIMLVMDAIVHQLSLGDWSYVYFITFIGLNYLTFKHKAVALLGHIILIILLAVLGSGISILYMALFLIYVMPYVCVYRETVKQSSQATSVAPKER